MKDERRFGQGAAAWLLHTARNNRGNTTRGFWMASKVLIGNVPFAMSGSELLTVLRSQGPVEKAWLAVDKATGRRRGHGYAEVETRQVADHLVRSFNGKLVLGHALIVAPIVR
jgi:RNA recognition motif-containing protein